MQVHMILTIELTLVKLSFPGYAVLQIRMAGKTSFRSYSCFIQLGRRSLTHCKIYCFNEGNPESDIGKICEHRTKASRNVRLTHGKISQIDFPHG